MLWNIPPWLNDGTLTAKPRDSFRNFCTYVVDALSLWHSLVAASGGTRQSSNDEILLALLVELGFTISIGAFTFYSISQLPLCDAGLCCDFELLALQGTLVSDPALLPTYVAFSLVSHKLCVQ